MKDALAGLFNSKKALAAMAGSASSALVLLAAKHGWALDPDSAALLVKGIMGLVAAYVLGQGIADWGKERAKIETAAWELVQSAHRLEGASNEEKKELLTEDV